jgi:hypothetical protein
VTANVTAKEGAVAEVKQVYRVELVVEEGEGEQHLDELDVERLITGEIDWSERIKSVHAEKLEEEHLNGSHSP